MHLPYPSPTYSLERSFAPPDSTRNRSSSRRGFSSSYRSQWKWISLSIYNSYPPKYRVHIRYTTALLLVSTVLLVVCCWLDWAQRRLVGFVFSYSCHHRSPLTSQSKLTQLLNSRPPIQLIVSWSYLHVWHTPTIHGDHSTCSLHYNSGVRYINITLSIELSTR